MVSQSRLAVTIFSTHKNLHSSTYMKLKLLIFTIVASALLFTLHLAARDHEQSPVVVAYVFRSDAKIDPNLMTHINYAFAHVTDSFDNLRIDNPDHLKDIVALKNENPDLKILLSVGGWGSGNFSEMAADTHLRKEFAKACRRIIDEYSLDGIDIDWEYPGSSVAGISSSPDDTDNFTLLMHDLRKALGKHKLLTLASAASAKHINFQEIVNYIDFVNIMTYDMAALPYHHAAMHYADSTVMTVERAVDAHLKAGIPASKLVLGMPFYGKGSIKIPRGTSIEQVKADSSLTEQWHKDGKYPYLTDSTGHVVYTFDNAHSLEIKCQYARSLNLRGTMYWEASCDDDTLSLSRAVWHATTSK